MSKEIEEFEQRVQKVQEFINNDELNKLSDLVVYQLSSSMNVVRDMNKVQTSNTSNGKPGARGGGQDNQVFKQHQQNRLQRFDKLILTFIQHKSNEVLTEEIKENIIDKEANTPIYK